MVVGIPVKATFALIATMLLLGTRATLRADAAATPDLSGYITSGFDGVVWTAQIEPIKGNAVEHPCSARLSGRT